MVFVYQAAMMPWYGASEWPSARATQFSHNHRNYCILLHFVLFYILYFILYPYNCFGRSKWLNVSCQIGECIIKPANSFHPSRSPPPGMWVGTNPGLGSYKGGCVLFFFGGRQAHPGGHQTVARSSAPLPCGGGTPSVACPRPRQRRAPPSTHAGRARQAGLAGDRATAATTTAAMPATRRAGERPLRLPPRGAGQAVCFGRWRAQCAEGSKGKKETS